MIRRGLALLATCAATSAAAMALYGCGRSQAVAQQIEVQRQDWGPRVWVDPRTGCEYLVEDSKGISARYHQNGLPICHGKEK